MPLTLLLLLPLLAPPPPPSAPPAAAPDGEAYEALVEEYEGAVARWRDALRAADRAGRKELRANRPAEAYWSAFERLAQDDGRALLWMLDHADEALDRRKEVDEARRALYERAVAEHDSAPWLPELLASLSTDAGMRRRFGEALVVELLTRVEETSESAQNRAEASYRLGLQQVQSDDEPARARGVERLERVAALGEESPLAETAREFLYDWRNLRVGRTAPELVSKTVDGEEIKLSDHRGKVVVLEFFGFW